MTRVAINGFGRIGRAFLRAAWHDPQVEVVAVNDLCDVENLTYLLKYDSVYRQFPGQVSAENGELVVGAKRIKVIAEKDPAKLPWKELQIDVVVESTGLFTEYAKAKVHVDAGAKKVVISAPPKGDPIPGSAVVLVGINEEKLGTCGITSNGSCTTNAAHPVVAVMNESVGVAKAFLATVHGYTATQNLVDGPTRGKDFRRGRAAAANISPSFTGAAISVTRPLPELAGKFDGLAYRVPIITGSLADITFVSKRKTSAEEINDIFTKAAASPRWKGILDVTKDQVVSSDIIGMQAASLVDLQYTKVLDGDLVKVLAWYDNEWGYVTTLVSHVIKAAESL